MWSQIATGLRINIFLTLLTGIIYPLVTTVICQAVFPYQANGSLIMSAGRAIGSELIGQNFAKPEYFHPRPSAAGTEGYDAADSGGSNYGPTNQKLIERVKNSMAAFRKENPEYRGPIPADLLTTSASGLDPHISPDSALAQAPRVANSRSVGEDQIKALIAQSTEAPDLGLLGEYRINVLKLNLALDRQFPRK